MIGQTISHYKILEKLGEGGMGVVYKAEDTKLDRFVAIKFLPHHIAANDGERQRFKVEAKAAAALNHPNIATIHAIEEADDQMFIVMEFIEGQELRKLLIDHGQLSIDDCLNYAAQIAEGLKAAHAKGITHRDIKSSNIMVTESGQVKIMDFGLAKISGGMQLTKSGVTLGTVAYMSPEQTRGAEVDHRTDIWALGVVLYEMITGQLPFKGEYETAVMYSIWNEEPAPITSLRANVPIELERVVEKALQKDRANRYQHVNELLADLKSPAKALASEPARITREKFPKRRRTFLYGGIAVFLISLIAIGLYFFPERRETIDSIAVLPLANLSGDPQQEYFADGMTEAMITELAKVKALRVISRTSVMQFKNTAKPLPEIARQLNVDAIVEGSVLRSGEQVRITAQLIAAKTDRHLWADSYERDLREVLTLQRQVALAITNEIQIKLTPQEQALLGDTRQVNPKAYDFYLWALKYRDMNDHEMTVHYCERAIEVDPDFAPAYALMVIPYVGSTSDEPKEVESKARRIAAKALQLDKTNADAHTAIGFIRQIYDWDWAGAEEEHKRAIELKPNSKQAHYDYGIFLCWVGRPEEGLTELKRAQAIEPLSEEVNAFVVLAYCFNRQYDEAIEQGRKMLLLHPESWIIHSKLGEAYVRKGMYKEAIAVFESEMMASNSWRNGFLGCAYALAGDREKSLKIINELQTHPEPSSKEHIAMIYTYLGEKNDALTWLERSYNEHSIYLLVFVFDPLFDPLRSEPRFQALLKKMGLKK